MVIYNVKDIDSIVFELKNNKALIAPTDTVPGLLAKYKNTIYYLKKRERNKKIILFICSFKHLESNDYKLLKLAKHFWPGSLTLVKDGISYRCPNNKFILELLSKTGPLYCSSANISGYDVIKDYNEAKNSFGIFGSDVIFLDSKYIVKKPSTVYDIDKDKILREGSISYEQIREVINN